MFSGGEPHSSQKSLKFSDDVEMSPGVEAEIPGNKGHPPSGNKSPTHAKCLEFPMFRVRRGVIVQIKWHIAAVVVWSTVVVSVWKYVEAVKYDFKPTLINLLGFVCGLLLTFRSNSAYDRYWEGRKLWSTMTLGIRNLTRAIWINVEGETPADIVKKTSATNLVIGFAIATKNYLREEKDYDFQDLFDITPHSYCLHTPSLNQPLSQQSPPTEEHSTPEMVIVDVVPEPTAADTFSKGVQNQKEKLSNVIAIKDQFPVRRDRFMALDIATPSNLPLELSYLIASYIKSVSGKCAEGTVAVMNSALGSLMECLTGFERIVRTPIPLAYSIHLFQLIWIYILALPFQLAPQNEWWTILIVGIAAFFLLGIAVIGCSIENPFDDDDNDLPLEEFCRVLKKEIQAIVSHKPMVAGDWVFKLRNKPRT